MFITFEGVEGAGKTTVVQAIAVALRERGASLLITREPGGSELGQELRRLLLGTSMDLDPLAELCLFLADRAQHVAKVIRPALARGDIVLCDRYTDSTLAYQGSARGLDMDQLRLLNQVVTARLVPDLTLLLDLPVEAGLARVASRKTLVGESESRIDDEKVSFHQSVRRGFHRIAELEPERVRVIDAQAPVGTVIASCLKEIEARIA